MAHKVETMAYTGDVPWHGLGVQVGKNLLPDEMLKEAGLNWVVNRERLYTEEGQKMVENLNALVRSSDGKILGSCKDTYKTIQNKDAFSFFHKFVKAGKMSMETAGSLDEGRIIWALARMKDADFSVSKGDDVKSYMLLAQPHIPGKAMTIMYTPIRVVCNNTLTMALSKMTEEQSFRLTHHKEFDDDIKELAEEKLGLALEEFKTYKTTAKYLASKKATKPQLDKYFAELFQPKMAIIDENEFNLTMRRLQEIYVKQPGSELSPNTWWTAFNAVTYWADHARGRDNDSSLNASWFGTIATKKQTALTKALEFAKASKTV